MVNNMDYLGISSMLYISGLGGVITHLLYFIHGEHHMHAPVYVITLVAIFCIISMGLNLNRSLLDSISISSRGMGAFFAGLLGSMLTYRICFHRLRRFPGPPLAKVSKLYHAWHCTKRNNFNILADWHAQYGEVVRVGPNELSILDPSAMSSVYGVRSRCYKAPWYDIGDPRESLHTVRMKSVHDERRKLWVKGLSPKVIKDFKETLFVHVHQLIDQIGKRKGQVVDMTQWANFFSFDVMSDLAFGQPFGMMSDGKAHYIMDLVHRGQRYLAVLGPVPWLARILLQIPGAMEGERLFKRWRETQVTRFKQDRAEASTLMSVFLDEAERTHDRDLARKWLNGDCRLIIVAGSDTTAATLVHIFYYLAQSPERVEALRTSLQGWSTSLNETRRHHLQDNEYLNAIIKETLRLHPPTPSGLLRLTPPEGLHYGKEWIPGGVAVSIPFHLMGRSNLAYGQPNEFIPERWFATPDLVLDHDAFMPFSSGSYACAGKSLAMAELQAVTSSLALSFDIAFAPDEDGSTLLDDSVDAFTLATAGLRLMFTPRSEQR